MRHQIRLLLSYKNFRKIKRLFDGGAYHQLYEDIRANGLNPILHYLDFGRKEGRFPNPLFDPLFYKDKYMNPEDSIDPLVHYLNNTEKVLDTHVLFDAEHYYSQLKNEVVQGTLLEHFLVIGWKKGYCPTPYFDLQYYLESNEDVKDSGVNPLTHYLLFGEREGRWPNLFFDPGQFEKPPLSETENFAVHQGRTKLESFAGTNTMSSLGMDHFFHRLDLENEKRVILFVSHEGSRTGAPLIILELARQLRNQLDILPINILLRGGELESDFDLLGPTLCSRHFTKSQNGFISEINMVLQGLEDKEIIGAIVNSAESRRILSIFEKADIKSISLVHEMAEFYPEQSWQDINDYSEKVVFPSQIVKKLALANSNFDLHKVEVIGQGLLDERRLQNETAKARQKIREDLGLAPNTKIVLACGTAIPRKGVDFFVHVGLSFFSQFREDSEDIYFVWLGTLPENDLLTWSVFDVERAGLEDKILFPGPTKDTTPFFEGSDVFFMTSRADPFPCVVHEAMAANLSIIAFEGGGGYTEAIEGGGGTILRYGDVYGSVNVIYHLLTDDNSRSRNGKKAKKRVVEQYKFADYATTLAQLLETVTNQTFEGLEKKEGKLQVSKKKQVIFTLPDWWISGVNTFVENLVSELNHLGFDAYILFTTMKSASEEKAMLPKVPYRFLYPTSDDYPDIWDKLKRYLEYHGPCVFVPNYDYVASAISADLSSNVGILGVLHSDDVEHYEHAYRLGHYWNNIVSVSNCIEQKLLKINPGFTDKSSVIYYGIEPIKNTSIPQKHDQLSIIYSGRIVEYQKRIFDFVPIIEKLHQLDVDFIFTFVGDGAEAPELKKALEDYILEGKVRWLGRQSQEVVFDELLRHHVIALTSDFEGLPLSVLEGLTRYCIPVVTDIESGINEVIVHRDNGLIAPIGDADAFVENLLWLVQHPAEMEKMAQNAYDTIEHFGLAKEQMGEKYAVVIHEMFDALENGNYERPPALNYQSEYGNIILPPMIQRVK